MEFELLEQVRDAREQNVLRIQALLCDCGPDKKKFYHTSGHVDF